MRAFNLIISFFLVLFLALSLKANASGTQLTTVSLDTLSDDEAAGLVFMREEEKLARDVYIYLYETWGQKTFDNIAASEQTHTDAMLELLHKYGIDDPVGDNAEGVFVDQNLQGLYDTLTATGSASLIDALLVGAAIEEIDLIDIKHLVDELDGNDDIRQAYENLIAGSENHLRAFVRVLEQQGITYTPGHLSQEEYDAIVK
mgnify:CR=1 FL=1